MGDHSLGSLFRDAEALRLRIESAQDTVSQAYLNDVTAAVNALEECRVLADQLSLFRSNETLEDISTGNLKYKIDTTMTNC